MSKPLVIVESPAKARTIAGFLGKDFVVESSIGHIRDLPQSADQVPEQYRGTPIAQYSVNLDGHFEPVYIVPPSKKKTVTTLKQALKNASELYLATDEDREGEAIAWHILEILKPKVPVKRMVFHEITPEAIQEAIDNSRELDMKLVEAQEGRRVLDRLVGYGVSPILWRRISPSARSAGRVQSVATRLIVDRERARMRFHTAEYWDLDGTFSAGAATFPGSLYSVDGKRLASGKDFDAETGRLTAAAIALDEAGARELAARLEGAPFTVASVETSDWKQSPRPPFITSTLQQEAGNKLGFSSSRAMKVAQDLYQNGYITYMRTDSTNLSDQAIAAARGQIREMYGDAYLPAEPRTYRRKVKNAQEAHEAIRPAGEAMRTPESLRNELSGDEFKLYDLIWKRTIACQMADARGKRVAVRLSVTSSAGEDVRFSANGRTIEFPGYQRAYVEGADNPDAELEDRESILPPMVEGDTVGCSALVANGHATQPPARYTEATLVKELEARGIGRPSTYAAVIQTVQDRGYVWKKGSALVPEWLAFATTNLLEAHFSHLVDYEFTARMEEDLDSIARGEAGSEQWLRDFWFGAEEPGLSYLIGEENRDQIDIRPLCEIPIGVDDAGLPIIVRVGRYGPYVEYNDETASLPPEVAPDELDVPTALEIIARKAEDGRELGTDPETGETIIARAGRFGPYVQLGEMPDATDKKAPKPKTASLFKTMSLDTITLDEALQLLALPRVVGADPEGNEITAQNGRYGPYIKKGTDSRSLETEEQIFTIDLAGAEALFAQPKRRGRQAKPPLADLGPHPETEKPVRVLDGRFGPYVTDGELNASLPRGMDPGTITMEDAMRLLQARAEKLAETGGKPVKRAKKAAKKATKKTAKKTTKKPAAKKTAAKKAPPKTAAAGDSEPEGDDPF